MNKENDFSGEQNCEASLIQNPGHTWFSKINSLFKTKSLRETIWDELEEALILSDVGVSIASDMIDKVKTDDKSRAIHDPSEVFDIVKIQIKSMLANGVDYSSLIKSLQPSGANNPIVILFVGVNGVGKTTTLAKMAYLYIESGHNVIIGAADTFRAAAIDQIKIWGERLNVDVVAHSQGSDPSAVVFDTIEAAKARKKDVVLIDTAGRMHNSVNLMEELNKMSRVALKTGIVQPKTILVLDTSTGQNGLQQARAFLGSIGCDGIVLTKFDGSSRGGVILSVYTEFEMPVLYIGTGEQLQDLQVFDPNQFADDLFSEPS